MNLSATYEQAKALLEDPSYTSLVQDWMPLVESDNGETTPDLSEIDEDQIIEIAVAIAPQIALEIDTVRIGDEEISLYAVGDFFAWYTEEFDWVGLFDTEDEAKENAASLIQGQPILTNLGGDHEKVPPTFDFDRSDSFAKQIFYLLLELEKSSDPTALPNQIALLRKEKSRATGERIQFKVESINKVDYLEEDERVYTEVANQNSLIIDFHRVYEWTDIYYGRWNDDQSSWWVNLADSSLDSSVDTILEKLDVKPKPPQVPKPPTGIEISRKASKG